MKEMSWKVYEKWLKPHEPFTFYYRNPGRILTSISDLEYPCPSSSNCIWDKAENKYIIVKQNPETEKTSYPIYTIKPEDIYDNVTSSFKFYYDKYSLNDEYKNHNLFMILKQNKENIDIAIGIAPAKGEYINEKIQRYIDSYHELKAFA
jgi:hypothetical protein